jgi:putative ABC transport system permease protein
MIRNYLIIAFRNLIRNKLHSTINIAGMAVGIAMFILIMMFVKNELSVDQFYPNLDRIYRLEVANFSAGCAAGVTDKISAEFPEIQKTVRMVPRNSILLKYSPENSPNNEKGIKFDDILYGDSTILDIFSLDVLKGDVKTALTTPFSLVLSESTVNKIFGEQIEHVNPIGQTIKVDNSYDCTITAIIKDIPQNSSISINGIISLISAKEIYSDEFLSNMSNWFYATYLLLSEKHDAKLLEEKINKHLVDLFPGNPQFIFILRPMRDIYFNDDHNAGDYSKHGDRQIVYIFIAIALIIIIIAIINFVNLSTATASMRANEVGVRKVVGSQKRNLITQFLSESTLISFVAIILAVIIAELLKPQFNELIGKKLEIGYLQSPMFILVLIGGALVIGIISGLYPAFYLTAFKAVDVLKGKQQKGAKGIFLRKTLLIIQFTISIILIIGTITVNKQLNYLGKKDLGFNKEHLIYLNLTPDIRDKKDLLRQKLVQNPDIKKVSFSNFLPGQMGGNTFTRKVNEESRHFGYIMTDPDYIDLMELEIVQGRNFSWDIKSDVGQAILLNETAVKTFKLDTVIGTEIYLFDTVGVVVGVVKDFNFKSLHADVEPLSILCLPEWSRIVNIRISSANMSQSIQHIQEVWNELSPEFPFEYAFFDEGLRKSYKSDSQFAKIFWYFSLLAIFIACLGLFGLVSFTAQRRTKEIGIRKVNGASIKSIVILLTKELTRWVFPAIVISCPIAYYVMKTWLQNFAYQTNISWWIFLLSSILALAIALVITSWQAIKAAKVNPVESLRSE